MSSLLLGDTAPDFRSNTQNGPFAFHDWLDGSWAVLFSHPKDFTPVCSTEIARAARLAGEFRKRRTKIATLSAGTAESHRQWAAELSDAFGVAIDFPLIVDDDRLTIARQYGMVHPKLSDITTVRSVFVIDPNKTIRLILTYPHTTGRNFDEILRVLDSLQTADRHSIVTPANWSPGERVLVPFELSDDDAAQKFGSVEKVLPYLRTVVLENSAAQA